MPPAIVRLTERNLESTFSKTPYMLVRVDRLPNVQLHRGLAEYLENRFPRLFTFVTLSRTDFAAARLTDLFQSSVGRLRSGVLDGYYLFEAGLVVGHHGGQPRPSSISYGAGSYGSEEEERIQRDRIVNALIAERVSSSDVETIRQLVAYLEPIIERKQRASGFSDDGTSHAYGSTTPPPPPRSAPLPDGNDPYVILGIVATATDDEVKSAYHNQMKLNHPDKVAHLSPALQQFAQQQTMIVKHAYDTILSLRGRPRG